MRTVWQLKSTQISEYYNDRDYVNNSIFRENKSAPVKLLDDIHSSFYGRVLCFNTYTVDRYLVEDRFELQRLLR